MSRDIVLSTENVCYIARAVRFAAIELEERIGQGVTTLPGDVNLIRDMRLLATLLEGSGARHDPETTFLPDVKVTEWKLTLWPWTAS